MLRIADTSHWSGKLDVAAIAAAGYSAIIAKVTEMDASRHFVDGQWERTKAACEAEGMPFTGYHFYRDSADPEAAAQFFFDHFGDPQGKLPAALDFETVPFDAGRCKACLDAMSDLLGYPAWAYTYKSFANEQLPAAWAENPEWYSQFPTGWANATDAQLQGAYPGVMHGFNSPPIAWQFSSTTSVPGVPDELCDVSVFLGSAADLDALIVRSALPSTVAFGNKTCPAVFDGTHNRVGVAALATLLGMTAYDHIRASRQVWVLAQDRPWTPDTTGKYAIGPVDIMGYVGENAAKICDGYFDGKSTTALVGDLLTDLGLKYAWDGGSRVVTVTPAPGFPAVGPDGKVAE
jgi:GH25 family lysozyme M1 (1,4-beta-N-acetylmuramidase)